MTHEELTFHCPPMGGAPDTEVVQEILTQLYFVRLKFRISYQENMTLEGLARDHPPMGGAPDAESFQKILRQEYLVNERE